MTGGGTVDYLRNAWYVAAWSSEIVPGSTIARTILELPIVLFRAKDGSAAALLDRCPHRFAPLSAGVLTDGRLACRYHGLAFDGSGACVLNPHGPALRSMAVRAFPVHEAHRAIWIWMGVADKADPASIPDLSYLAEAPDTAFSCGQLLSGAGNYEVFVDNILDLSHTDYLHPDTLGGGNNTAAKQQIEDAGDYFDVTWYSRDIPPAPLLASLVGTLPPRTDSFARVRWFAPGIMKLSTGVMAAGAYESTALNNFNAHIMTPENGRSTHYFFAATRNYRMDDGELNARIATGRRKIFETEDKPMIELVDARMGDVEFWSMRPVLLSIDGASVRARRRLQARIAAEQAETTTDTAAAAAAA